MNLIQFPLKHGPITEHEFALSAVQQAAEKVLGRRIDPERAACMAELIVRRKGSQHAGELIKAND